MAGIQINLLPMAYYNTLGFDRELIDYIEFVNDEFVYDLLLPLFKKGGRPPHNPVMMFRAHYLYFAKQEISSYRQLEKVLKNPKNQDYRNFMRAYSIKEVPSHSSMSEYRKKVGVENFYRISRRMSKLYAPVLISNKIIWLAPIAEKD